MTLHLNDMTVVFIYGILCDHARENLNDVQKLILIFVVILIYLKALPCGVSVISQNIQMCLKFWLRFVRFIQFFNFRSLNFEMTFDYV